MEDTFGTHKEGLDADLVFINIPNPLKIFRLKRNYRCYGPWNWLSKESIDEKLKEIAK